MLILNINRQSVVDSRVVYVFKNSVSLWASKVCKIMARFKHEILECRITKYSTHTTLTITEHTWSVGREAHIPSSYKEYDMPQYIIYEMARYNNHLPNWIIHITRVNPTFSRY